MSRHAMPAAALTLARRRWPIGAALALAVALRLLVRPVSAYSRADEAVYVEFACRVRAGGLAGYEVLVRDWLAHPDGWLFPPPIRWGFVSLGAAVFGVTGRCGASSLAWLATIAGVAAVYLTWRVGTRLLGERAGLVALVLSAASPLQLAMGRRALADEAFCALALGALLALLCVADADRSSRRRHLVAIAAIAACFSVKETTWLLYPAFAAALILRRTPARARWGDVWLFVAPPVLHAVAFTALARDPGAFVAVARAQLSAIRAPYTALYQSGPPHRLLLDMLALSPAVSLLAVAGLARAVEPNEPRDRGARTLAVLAVAAAAPFLVAPAMNVRFFVVTDALARLLAASLFAAWWPTSPRGRAAAWGTLAACCALDGLVFHRVFVAADVYDPVTDNVLRALGAIP